MSKPLKPLVSIHQVALSFLIGVALTGVSTVNDQVTQNPHYPPDWDGPIPNVLSDSPQFDNLGWPLTYDITSDYVGGDDFQVWQLIADLAIWSGLSLVVIWLIWGRRI
jgi:hypothetical protein